MVRERPLPSGPAYDRLAETIRAEIAAGVYPPGSRLPTEFELMEVTGLGRHTVRAALELLSSQGLIRREPGRGTFVTAAAIGSSAARILGGDDQVFGDALGSRVKVLERFATVSDEEVAARLELADDKLTRVRFTRVVKRARVGVWTVSLPPELYDLLGSAAQSLDRSEGSVIAIVEREAGRVSHLAEQLMSAEAADDETARILGLAAGSPLLRAERVYFDDSGKPFEHVLVYYNPFVYAYRLQLVRKAGGRSARTRTSRS